MPICMYVGVVSVVYLSVFYPLPFSPSLPHSTLILLHKFLLKVLMLLKFLHVSL